MYWNSFSDFLAMGQHGVYVWGSVAVTAFLMTLEPLLVKHSQGKLITRLKRQIRAENSEQRSRKKAAN